MSALLKASDADAALEHLHASGCTDGLPVVIPTPARVERMVLRDWLLLVIGAAFVVCTSGCSRETQTAQTPNAPRVDQY